MRQRCMLQGGHKVGNVRVAMEGVIAAPITGGGYGSVWIVVTNVPQL